MNFERAVDFVLRQEGGYVNDPKDPGGETNFGISKRAYPNIDIRNLTKEKAAEIYRIDYWNPSRAEVLPDYIKLVHFSTAVNCGLAKANEIMNKSHGSLEIYSWFLTMHYIDLARRKPALGKFLAGWLNRTADVYSESVK